MFVDFVLNGEGHGEVGEQVAGCRFDPGLMRPYLDNNGRLCVTVNTGETRVNNDGEIEPVFRKMTVNELAANGYQVPTANATSLRKEEWIQLDRAVLAAARQRLRAWGDLSAASSFGGFNGMAKTILEYESMSDPGEASVDMDGLTEGRASEPKYQLQNLPLPITHSGFYFSSRRLAVSRNTGTPLDTTMAEAASRRVAETIEKTLIGVQTGLTYGPTHSGANASKVYGYTNFPDRQTKTDLATPTGANADATVADVLEMRDLAYAANFYGPFMLYHSNDWDQFMDNDYAMTNGSNYGVAPNKTLRSRLREIEGISDVRRLDFLTDTFTLVLVQMTSEVARAVNGMDITTVQWETKGGMQVNFKVMAIMVPQLRADFSGNCGIVHGTTS